MDYIVAKETFSTLIYRDNETEEKDVVVYFTVPRGWAEKWVEDNAPEYESLEDFFDNYIWDESYSMYESAVEDDVILHIEEDENVIRIFV